MTTIKVHFDGKTFVPDEPVNFPKGTPLYILVGKKRPMTVKDILESGLVGLWKDRTDIGDSPEFTRKLRQQAETHQQQELV